MEIKSITTVLGTKTTVFAARITDAEGNPIGHGAGGSDNEARSAAIGSVCIPALSESSVVAFGKLLVSEQVRLRAERAAARLWPTSVSE